MMVENKSVRRLFVGGLGHTISHAELEDRFSKFGDIAGVEIVSRKDEQGNPSKTFAYLNVNISEPQLKKCMSILNKTKWKGGVLQIELAKESYLHRLSKERLEANKKQEAPQMDRKPNLVQSMQNAGVENFHMKAVPGTEVPDHKDWVVSKFGRVLPVLHLRDQHKNKIIKYDPSKYCHNLKRFEEDPSGPVPISQLTWHIEEGDDEISRKRRGEFPSQTNQSKKKKVTQNCMNREDSKNVDCALQIGLKELKKHNLKPVAGAQRFRNRNRVLDSDVDSEEEMEAILAKENTIPKGIVEEDFNLEVVKDNFQLKYATHWGRGKSERGNYVPKAKCSGDNSDYDSADTDEIIAVTLPQNGLKNNMLKESTPVKFCDSKKQKVILPSEKCETNSVPRKTSKCTTSKLAKATLSLSHPGSGSESDSETGSSGTEVDREYEEMMQNCHLINLTLNDLEKLASTAAELSDDERMENTRESCLNQASDPAQKLKSQSEPMGKRIIEPNDILASLLEEESTDDERKAKKRTVHPKAPAFRGLGSLANAKMVEEQSLSQSESSNSKQSKTMASLHTRPMIPPHFIGNKTGCAGASSLKAENEYELISEKHDKQGSASSSVFSPAESGSLCKSESTEEVCDTNSSGSSDDEQTSTMKESSSSDKSSSAIKSKNIQQKTPKSRAVADLKAPIAKVSVLQSEKIKSISAPVNKLAASPCPEVSKHLVDNEKRLAAVQERQKEIDLQKKLIQGALSNLEPRKQSKGCHIVFNSDTEEDVELEENTVADTKDLPKTKEDPNTKSSKLFESSDEEDAEGNDDDDQRFSIKSQFEGKAGEKLMHLQSRFGTDERFRMDSRFLGSSSEEDNADEATLEHTAEEVDLSTEKKKNLEILQSLMHIDIGNSKPSKQMSKAKTFRDVNTLQYDPTREDHAVFEIKLDSVKKESKAKRKKIREEAEKLPEVSKDIFHDVAVDFKEVFGSAKAVEEEKETAWDLEEENDTMEVSGAATQPGCDFSVGTSDKGNATGFTFSFFEEDEKAGVLEEPYKIEIIKPSKVIWKEDKHFQDSSDEEEEQTVVKNEDFKMSAPSQLEKNVERFFFFSRDDQRLKDGPKMFWRSSTLEEDKDAWEERRATLLEECRKRHKDAKRKIKVQS